MSEVAPVLRENSPVLTRTCSPANYLKHKRDLKNPAIDTQAKNLFLARNRGKQGKYHKNRARSVAG